MMMMIIPITPIERQEDYYFHHHYRRQHYQQYHSDERRQLKFFHSASVTEQSIDVLPLFIITLKSTMYCWCETLRDEGLALLQMKGEPQETF